MAITQIQSQNPLVAMTQMQMAALDGMQKMGVALLSNLNRACDLAFSVGTCADQRHDCCKPAEDADFTSHYGRRAHDIDPEHDV